MNKFKVGQLILYHEIDKQEHLGMIISVDQQLSEYTIFWYNLGLSFRYGERHPLMAKIREIEND